MIEKLPESEGNILGYRLSGKLHDEDYQQWVPELEAAIAAHGKIRLLAEFHDFHGWDAKALWDDIKFDAKHASDFERIAMIGEKTWEKWMAKVCKPFTSAKIKYFDAGDRDAAWAWLKE
jgi:hypothetical protein